MFDAKLKAEDVGTRLEHLMDLQELWSWAWSMRNKANSYYTDLEKEESVKLDNALEMLNHILMGYQGPTSVPAVINALPKDAKDIPNDTIVLNENKIT